MISSPTRPRAQIDLSALVANARGADGALDLRRNAWGHGLLNVVDALVPAVTAPFLLDDDAHALLSERRPELRTRLTSRGEAASGDLLYGLDSGIPVATVHGRVLMLKELLAGQSVSYGHTYTAERDTRIALVTGGYAHGLVRALGNQLRVRVRDQWCPLVGRVAMDVCVVEVGGAQVQRGDPVTLIGQGGPRAAVWASLLGLRCGEIITAALSRARKIVA